MHEHLGCPPLVWFVLCDRQKKHLSRQIGLCVKVKFQWCRGLSHAYRPGAFSHNRSRHFSVQPGYTQCPVKAASRNLKFKEVQEGPFLRATVSGFLAVFLPSLHVWNEMAESSHPSDSDRIRLMQVCVELSAPKNSLLKSPRRFPQQWPGQIFMWFWIFLSPQGSPSCIHQRFGRNAGEVRWDTRLWDQMTKGFLWVREKQTSILNLKKHIYPHFSISEIHHAITVRQQQGSTVIRAVRPQNHGMAQKGTLR